MSYNVTTTAGPASGTSWMSIIQRAKIDFEEMPGLALTASQAARMWRIESHIARDVLMAMVDAGYLSTGPGGFTRQPSKP